MKDVILFGYGKMGSSIAKGWMLRNLNFNFFIIEKKISLRKTANKDGFKAFESIEHLKEHNEFNNFDIIFLAVKPQQMEDTVKIFYKLNLTKSLFISIAAGLSFSWFKTQIGSDVKIVRAMPNLPASIGFGVTGYCKSSNISDEDEKETMLLLSAFSETIFLRDESLIDVVTAISGSGPAYIFYFVELLAQIGAELGLPSNNAKALASKTLIGSARMLEDSKSDPKILKKNVTSPGGTTEAGLKELEAKVTGLYPVLKLTINMAKKRAMELNING